jgi:cytochrome c553
MRKANVVVLALAVAVSVPAVAAGDPVAGKAKSPVCAACHGPDGNSPTGDFPKLAGQNEDYLVAALTQYKSGKRKNPIMAGMGAPLSKQDMADLAAYFASQQGLQLKY